MYFNELIYFLAGVYKHCTQQTGIVCLLCHSVIYRDITPMVSYCNKYHVARLLNVKLWLQCTLSYFWSETPVSNRTLTSSASSHHDEWLQSTSVAIISPRSSYFSSPFCSLLSVKHCSTKQRYFNHKLIPWLTLWSYTRVCDNKIACIVAILTQSEVLLCSMSLTLLMLV